MPSEKAADTDLSNFDWKKSIQSILKSSEARQVKKVRKMVLLSLQLDDSDKTAKKVFKKKIQEMESEGSICLDAEGVISLKERKRKSDDGKKAKKSKKKKKIEEATTDEGHVESRGGETTEQKGDKPDSYEEGPVLSEKTNSKNKPSKGNPKGITRLFLGNLPFSVDESSLNAFLPGEVTHVKWITDKETGKFYGSAFIEMDSASFTFILSSTSHSLMDRT